MGIPDKVKSTGARAFEDCLSLTEIYIPKNVLSIEYGAFIGCDNLTIYCEIPSQSVGWGDNWNVSNCSVVWRYSL